MSCLRGPIRSGPADSDGAVIGPILARIGADSGVSLPMDPAHIQGFGNTWSLDNPVPGQPAGVVAVRVGTASSGFGQFVRIGDTRDPSLQGNLTVAGNTLFGDGTTRSEFRSALQVDAPARRIARRERQRRASRCGRTASSTSCATARCPRPPASSATRRATRRRIAGTGLVTGGNVAGGRRPVDAPR